LWPAV